MGKKIIVSLFAIGLAVAFVAPAAKADWYGHERYEHHHDYRGERGWEHWRHYEHGYWHPRCYIDAWGRRVCY